MGAIQVTSDQHERPRIQLTDTEWMEIIVRDRDGLPPCCANISALRSELVAVAQNDGYSVFFTDFDTLRRTLGWCFPDHDVPSPEIQKVMDQLGWEPQADGEHEKQSIE